MRTAVSTDRDADAATDRCTEPLPSRAGALATGPVIAATHGDDDGRTLAVAILIAARAGADVAVVSAVEPPMPGMVGLGGRATSIPSPDLHVSLRRRQLAGQLHAAHDAAWPIDVVVGEPSRVIADAARERRASLVVMGVGHHDAAARLLGGEVTLRAMRRARVPVLAIGPTPMRVPPRIAVAAIDFSASSVKAARAALDLLDDGGTLHLVHAWSRTAIEHPALLVQDDAYALGLAARFAKTVDALRARQRDVTITTHVVEGAPAEQIAAFAAACGADVVAAGRQGHGLIERLLVGRVTTGLLRAAPCAVLVTPEPCVTEREAIERTLTGTSESHAPAEWPALLDAFSRRNRARRTVLEVDDPALGAQAQETGYALLGAAYDRHDGRVELMFGMADGAVHLTRMIAGVTSISIDSNPAGRDAALRLTHDDGHTVLSFLPNAP